MMMIMMMMKKLTVVDLMIQKAVSLIKIHFS